MRGERPHRFLCVACKLSGIDAERLKAGDLSHNFLSLSHLHAAFDARCRSLAELDLLSRVRLAGPQHRMILHHVCIEAIGEVGFAHLAWPTSRVAIQALAQRLIQLHLLTRIQVVSLHIIPQELLRI